MKKYVVFAIVLFAAYSWQKRATPPSTVVSKFSNHDEIIMYSLTTCGHCKLMAGALQNTNIAFTERFIDTDENAKNEMFQKLKKAGMSSRSVGMPTLDVRGKMMPDNPGLAAVRSQLKL
jgi:glutaredoxin